MNDLIKIIFGDYNWFDLFGYLWFFFIGYLIYGLTEVKTRDVASKNTPEKFSWKFWFYDNWRRYLTTILCTYVFFRFYTEINGREFTNLDAVLLGLVGDGVAAKIKENVNFFGAKQRQQLTEKIKKELGEE